MDTEEQVIRLWNIAFETVGGLSYTLTCNGVTYPSQAYPNLVLDHGEWSADPDSRIHS